MYSLPRHSPPPQLEQQCARQVVYNNNNNNIIIIKCNLVVTRWQWLFYMYTNMKKSN